jgi:hypothetical protein
MTRVGIGLDKQQQIWYNTSMTKRNKMKTWKQNDKVQVIQGGSAGMTGTVRLVSPQLVGTNMGVTVVMDDGGLHDSFHPNNLKTVVGFENLVGDGPSGFDFWHDTRWCC